MKVQTLATAFAATLLCQAATAQSQVQLYGLLDLTVARMTGPATGINKLDRGITQLVNGGLSTSHFGVRGSEDLGGGLSASFELSSFVRVDTGATGRSDAIGAPVNVAADPFWARAAWVGLGSPSFGRLRLGNQTSLLFLNAITSNAFGDSTVFGPLNLVTFIGGPLSGGTGWTNQALWDSPRMGNFSVSAAHSFAENNGGSNQALRAAWSTPSTALSFAAQKVDKNPSTFADGTSANNTRSWQLAASHDFKVVKVWAHLGRIQNRGTEAAPLDIGYRVWDLSLAVPVGAGRLLAGVAERKTGDSVGPVPATVAGGNIARRVATLGYDHNLSKRTDVYVMAMSDRTETRTLPAPGSVQVASGSSYGIGLRHRF